MNRGAVNVEWACSLLEALVAGGVSEMQIAPGSRSAPLVLAAAALPLKVRVHLDERSAGFFALGYARESGMVTPVVTTSGTAAANLAPSMVEAHASDVPMMLLTADRPPRLRGSDANQTIDQTTLLKPLVRHFRDLPLPDPTRLAVVYQAAGRALSEALGPMAGPVHLNVPFDKPLQPEDLEELKSLLDREPDVSQTMGRPERRRIGLRRLGFDPGDAEDLRAALLVSRRPLLFAGPSSVDQQDGPALREFALRWGIPLLADPLSGARFGPRENPCVMGSYDHLLRDPDLIKMLTPDLVIRTGRAPTSAGGQAALEAWAESPQWVVDAGFQWKDHAATASRYIRAEVGDFMPAVCEPAFPVTPLARDDAKAGWLSSWQALESAAWEAVEEGAGIEGNEGGLAAAVVRALPDGATLMVSSSMPVRDVDGYGRPTVKDLRILGNRGASGIDGIVSTILGCAAAASGEGAVVGLLGDLAFYHDMNGLLASREEDLNVVLVLVDNDGGGIFHHLPIRAFEPTFTSCFATPHGLDFEKVAGLYEIPFRDCRSPDELGHALKEELAAGGVRIIRCKTDRDVSLKAHRETTRLVHRLIHERMLDQPFRELSNDDA